jgi:S1-C subfamily serine protease
MLRARAIAAPLLGVGLLLAAMQPGAAQIKLSIDEKVGNTKGWTIAFNQALGGCLAVATYKDETTVWFGLGKAIGPYVAFTNPKWNKIEPGKKYELQLQMRGYGSWKGSFTGVERGNEKGLITTDVKAQFFGDFAKAGGIVVNYNGSSLARLDLLGSRAALEDIIACQKSRPTVAASNPAPKDQPKQPPKEKGESSGTGFFVSSKGHVLTNHHVIDGCSSFQVAQGGAPSKEVRVLARDEKNDLALLSTDLKPDTVPVLRTGVRVGENISIYGFPLAGLLASSGNFTTGNVTAAAGLADDTRMVQISAPVQPGNSGGPLIDQYGNVVGVIVSKLNALKVAQVTSGDLPQNVNFAIKTVIALAFLEANDITAAGTASTTALDATQIAERAKAFTVRITCK